MNARMNELRKLEILVVIFETPLKRSVTLKIDGDYILIRSKMISRIWPVFGLCLSTQLIASPYLQVSLLATLILERCPPVGHPPVIVGHHVTRLEAVQKLNTVWQTRHQGFILHYAHRRFGLI